MDFEEAKEKALCILDLKPHSRRELRAKLLRREIDAETADAVLDDLEDLGLINDAEYADILIRHMTENKKFGRHRIKNELIKKGIDPCIIETAMEERGDDDIETLYPLVEKKLDGCFDKKSVDRAVRYFVSHGYSAGDIFKCVTMAKERSE